VKSVPGRRKCIGYSKIRATFKWPNSIAVVYIRRRVAFPNRPITDEPYRCSKVCEYPPINCPATVVISNRESYWGTLRLSEIEFAVNTLIDLLLGIYVNFQNHGRNRCSLAEYVRIVDKTICLVRMLFCLVDNVNRSSADEPIDQLIEDYDKCRKMYYKIKNSMAACGCWEQRSRTPVIVD